MCCFGGWCKTDCSQCCSKCLREKLAVVFSSGDLWPNATMQLGQNYMFCAVGISAVKFLWIYWTSICEYVLLPRHFTDILRFHWLNVCQRTVSFGSCYSCTLFWSSNLRQSLQLPLSYQSCFHRHNVFSSNRWTRNDKKATSQNQSIPATPLIGFWPVKQTKQWGVLPVL